MAHWEIRDVLCEKMFTVREMGKVRFTYSPLTTEPIRDFCLPNINKQTCSALQNCIVTPQRKTTWLLLEMNDVLEFLGESARNNVPARRRYLIADPTNSRPIVRILPWLFFKSTKTHLLLNLVLRISIKMAITRSSGKTTNQAATAAAPPQHLQRPSPPHSPKTNWRSLKRPTKPTPSWNQERRKQRRMNLVFPVTDLR